MIPLRIAGILSNMAFIGYAALEDLYPVLLLHCLLLPTNLYRLYQIRQLIRVTREVAPKKLPIDPLIPFMKKRRIRDGEVLFRNGDPSDGMYYIADGRIRIPEIGKTLEPGEILGEISLFAPDKARTASAVGEGDGLVYRLSETAVVQAFHQNPEFGFSLMRAITGRLVENYRTFERRSRAGTEE